MELGVNFIDTADSYGPYVSEELIREALHPYPDDLVIATKAGLLRTGPEVWVPLGKPAYLRQEVEMSLVRLGVDTSTLDSSGEVTAVHGMAGVSLVPLTSKAEDGFHLPPREAWEKVLSDRTRMVILCNACSRCG